MDVSVLKLARRQHGVISKEQWRAFGHATSTWYRALERGELVTEVPNVARIASHAATFRSTAKAVSLAIPGSVISHASSAHLWGVMDEPKIIEATTSGAHPTFDGVRLHRPTDRRGLRAVSRQAIPTTDPLRLLGDLGATESRSTVTDVLERFIIARRLTLSAAEATLGRRRGRGCPGVTSLAAAIDELRADDRPADSVLEAEMARLCRTYRLPRLERHPSITAGGVKFHPDFLHRESRVIVEVDGWEHHVDRRTFERDRERDVWLSALRYTVIRFTWRQIRRRPAEVAAQLAAVIASRSAPSR